MNKTIVCINNNKNGAVGVALKSTSGVRTYKVEHIYQSALNNLKLDKTT